MLKVEKEGHVVHVVVQGGMVRVCDPGEKSFVTEEDSKLGKF